MAGESPPWTLQYDYPTALYPQLHVPVEVEFPLIAVQSASLPHIIGNDPVETAAGMHVYWVLNSPPVFSQFDELQSELTP